MTLLFFFGTPALLLLVGLAFGWYVEYREPPAHLISAKVIELERTKPNGKANGRKAS
jgi:hypothetical protein